MIILFRKSQLSLFDAPAPKPQMALFDAPVHVHQHVRKDGVIVPEHIRLQKIKAKRPAPAPRQSKLDAFIAKHGGAKELGSTLANLSEGQQQRLFAEMARLDGITPEQVADRFAEHIEATRPVPATAAAVAPAPVTAPAPAAPADPFAIEDTKARRKAVLGVLGEGWKATKGVEGSRDAFKKKANGVEVTLMRQRTVDGSFYVGANPGGFDSSAKTLEEAKAIAEKMLPSRRERADARQAKADQIAAKFGMRRIEGAVNVSSVVLANGASIALNDHFNKHDREEFTVSYTPPGYPAGDEDEQDWGFESVAEAEAKIRELTESKSATPAVASQEPKEGDRKTNDGVEYVLRDGRWHRASEDQKMLQLQIPEEQFAELLHQAADGGDEGIPYFTEPAETVRTEKRAEAEGELTMEQAQAKLDEWKAHARAQGQTGANGDKVVLSLFDTSGRWSQPWAEAGYQVQTVDLQDGIDINDFSVEYLVETLGLDNVHVILAAPPCTDFASSGAHAWQKKDADGRTEASVELVRQTLRTVEYFKPSIWAIENPVGRIRKMTGLPKPAITFQPNNFGDPYTKRTMLWGDMNAQLPLANVAPTEGSKITSKISSSDKNARSLTPEGFAYAFFMANNLEDLGAAGRLAAEFKGIPVDEFKAAIDAGIPEHMAYSAVADDYYDHDLEGARRALRQAIADAPAAAAAPAAPAPAPAHDPASPFGVVAGISKAERREINGQVIKRLEQGGPYTEDDLELLRQYSGNGGCGDSLNEYYTDPAVARAMWDAIAALGFTHGEFLEPSSGTGVFLHTAPEGFKGTAVELDPVAAGVAAALHDGRHEVHTASLERFATMDDRQFDVVIGNPPYGPRGMLAKDDKKYISNAEDYFVDTAIDKAKPGGIVALVVPTGVLDSKSRRSAREAMLCRAEFLGALRMPNTAFEHSHTEVTTDVVFLRKRPDDVGRALINVKVNDQKPLQELGVWDDEFIAGSYFTGRGAKNILGTMAPGWRAQAGMGDDITVDGSMVGVPESIAEFQPDSVSRGALSLSVQDVLQAVPEGAPRDAVLAAAQRPRAYEFTAKVGDQKTVDGVTYILQGDPPRWHRIDEFMQSSAAITDAQGLAQSIERLVTGAGAVDRPALEAAVQAYVDKHGVPADNPDLMTAAMADKVLYRLVGAVDRKGKLSDAVAGRVPRAVEGGFDATAEAMALENESGNFAAKELAERLGKGVEDVEDQLAADSRYAWDGASGWTTMDLYLTGDLWSKLDIARTQLEAGDWPFKDKLRDQVARLEKAIDPKSLEDVEVQINSAFLPLHVLEAYFNWRQYDSPQATKWSKEYKPVQITFEDGIYKIQGGNTWGDTKLLEKYLNRTGIRKEEDVPVIERWNGEFKDWLCASTYRDAVEDLYNRKFRGYVARKFSDSPIDVPGLAAERGVRPWRWDSLRNSLALGKGIIADDVGLGKTLGGLLLARMAKVQGRAQKPVIVVPKSVLANWFAETQVWFPGSRVLTIGANFAHDKNGELVGRDDDATERKRKYHDLTQNDYDFILVSEPAFEEVDLDPATKEKYYGEDFWVQRGDSLGNAGDKKRKAIRERFEQSVAKREFEDHTDAIYFNELGVDMLIADEMHHQKNLYAARARFGENPKFLGGSGQSNRALDFNLKTRWIRENNDGKGVYGLTATPTKNSPLEVYSMLSHIAPEAFEKIGIRNSEEFLDRFCMFENDKVLNTRGEIEDALVVSGFKNLNELRPIMARYIDRRTAVQVGLKLPERQQKMHLVDMTPAQQDVYAELRALAEESSGKKDSTGDSHIFSIMDKMNKAALDLEILDDKAHAGASSPKYAELAKSVIEGAKEGGQIVFCEAVPSHEKIKRALIDSGIPASQIAIINAKVASSAVKRQNIADAFNKGKLKVVIGNCTMAEGLNMQKTTTDIHELDIPWEPATVQQRLGRGIRQGNLNEAVRTHSYLAKGSFDGYRYQAVHAKRDWMDILWNGGDRVENLAREGAFTLDDMRIMLAADPEAAKAEFEADKAAAMQRFEAGARESAQEQYVKFTELSRSHKALKNQDSVSARRLRQRVEAAKTALFNNKYWPDKTALDHAGDVLVDPKTGTVLKAGQGVDLGVDGKSVITGVNMRAGTVTVRKWAGTGGERAATVPLKELADAKFFDHDQDAENAEVARQLTEAATSKLDSISSWDDIAAMPPAVVDANRDLIQRQVKDAAKGYKFTFPHGDIPMVNKDTGKIETFESYFARDKHDTHDYLLPTSDAIERAQQAWIEAERTAKIGKQFHTGKRNKSWQSAARKYEGARYDSKHTNPMRPVLSRLGGGHGYEETPRLVKEAKAQLEQEQHDRIRHAKSAKDAIHALAPLADISGQDENYGDEKFSAKYPQRALTAAWARARHLGELHKPLVDALASEKNGAGVDFPHDWYAVAGHKDKSVHHALTGMALASGHRDLAEAMLEADARDPTSQADPADTVKVLGNGWAGHHSKRTLELMLRAAEKAGIADQTLAQLSALKLRGAFAAPATYGHGYGASSRSLREKIAELMPKEQTEEAAA